MNKITITIELDNDSFQPHPEPEIGRILVNLAHRMERYGVDGLDKILDSNGNTVGRITTT